MTASTLLISDYAGYAFTVELARTLHERGHDVAYSYCRSVTSPKGLLEDGSDLVVPVSAGARFEKYRLGRRLISELRYGVNTARLVWRRRPATHVVSDMPLLSLLIIWATSLPLRTRLVVWFQDVQSGLVAGVRGQGIVSRSLGALEGFLLRRSSIVIAISDALAGEARRRRVRPDRIVVIENWGPLEALPMRPRRNWWSAAHGLDHRPVLMYSGTLAKKHRAETLETLARRLQGRGAIVVVVSEGEGAERLLARKAGSSDLDSLRVMPYQPFETLPDVLASADVLIVLLEHKASRYSVPSKTLSYLCAGRPILAAVPSANPAARIVAERAGAGIVVEPDDVDGFCAAAEKMLDEPEVWAQGGARGREYAEQHFARDLIADRFERVLGLGAASTAAGPTLR
jgi:colanic acid biosynthesis glycosyl transferase WcaI